jgi:hypothetical protein
VRFLFVLISSLAIIAVASPAAASEVQSGVVVLNVQVSNGIKPELSELLTDILLVQLRKTGAFKEVLGMADVSNLLALDQQKTLLGCANEECLAQVGGALGVPYFLRSQVGLLGKAYVLTLHLVSVEEAKVVSRSLAQASDEGALMAAIGSALNELLKDFSGGAPSIIATAIKGARSWKALTGYGLAAVGLGLYGLATMRQEAAQRTINRGPMDIDELELDRALAENGEATRYGFAAASAATLGVGLVVWGLMP